MAFTNTWDEASPPGTDFARTADDHLRKSKTDIRERGGVEHITYVTEGANTDVWEHKSGQCKVAYVGTKATFPSVNRKGALAIATDENNSVYFNDSTAWVIHDTTNYAQALIDAVTVTIPFDSNGVYYDVTGVSVSITNKRFPVFFNYSFNINSLISAGNIRILIDGTTDEYFSDTLASRYFYGKSKILPLTINTLHTIKLQWNCTDNNWNPTRTFSKVIFNVTEI